MTTTTTPQQLAFWRKPPTPFTANPLMAGVSIHIAIYLPGTITTLAGWATGKPASAAWEDPPLLDHAFDWLAAMLIVGLIWYSAAGLRLDRRAVITFTAAGLLILSGRLPEPWASTARPLLVAALVGWLAYRHLIRDRSGWQTPREVALTFIPIPAMAMASTVMGRLGQVLPPPGPPRSQFEILGLDSEPELLTRIAQTSVVEEGTSALMTIGMYRRGVPVWLIFVINGLLRMDIHLYAGWGSVGPVLMAVTMTGLYLHFGRLRPLIVAHAVFDLAVSHLPGQVSGPVLLILTLTATAALVAWVIRLNRQAETLQTQLGHAQALAIDRPRDDAPSGERPPAQPTASTTP
ncbi:hypothetical protein C1I98_30480 [Spongiactinospora gelatinilytica]|uniref:CPBP family intramembrane metalloprotease n=1 Tax=Spongiactinospora gelatinilytica TaxID=2666298 RepID=A0A2W2F660_9ACTN|nr:CPBP family intramembrane metalloprotease [Spongiactinospora gelatinilytica]PZG31051.1 hypothetical protein C1I98_30480 [Spongiactinospora gelatinilytica]